MKERGTSAAVGVIVLFSIVFACYMAYSIFNTPVTTIITTMENVDVDDTVPDSIWNNLATMWQVWVIVLVILTFLIVIAYAHRGDYTHGYE